MDVPAKGNIVERKYTWIIRILFIIIIVYFFNVIHMYKWNKSQSLYLVRYNNLEL